MNVGGGPHWLSGWQWGPKGTEGLGTCLQKEQAQTFHPELSREAWHPAARQLQRGARAHARSAC